MTIEERLDWLETAVFEIQQWASETATLANARSYALEVHFANWVADMAKEDADAFLLDLASPYRTPRARQTELSEDEVRILHERTLMHLEEFLRAVSDRADRIRADRYGA